MKKLAQSAAFAIAFFCALNANAQLSGTYGVPSTFSTIAAAINSLNIAGISGSVSIDIAAGHTETATTGGYSLTATGTSANPIIFRKVGIGANPLITAYTGTATPATATQDGVWRLIGSDYITIDGIDIIDPNTTNPATMEFGYCLFKASVTDGCQYNTIQNCVITLNRVNNATGSGPSIEGSKGINVINALTSANITNLTPTSAAGSNSFNRFYSNTIQNCNMGIVIMGYAAPSPFTLGDFGNDIGGTSISTGNTIINYGGGGTSASEGISVQGQRDINISYNFINSNNGGGVNHAGIIKGIILNTSTSANAVVSHNTVTIKPGGTTSAVGAIQNASGSTAANNTITIENNIISNCTYTTATSGTFNGILNSGTPAFLNINNNVVSNNIQSGTGVFTGINGAGAAAVTISMNSNTVTANSKSGASGTMYCMRAGTSSVTVNGNTINNNSIPTTTGTAAASIYGYYNIGSPTFEVYTNNIIDNLNISGTSSSSSHAIYGLYTNSTASSIKEISGNQIGLLNIANNLAGGTIYGIYQSIGTTINYSKNKIYDLSCGGAAGNVYGIYANSGSLNTFSNNIIGNLSTPSSSASIAIAGVYLNGGAAAQLYYNTIYINASSTATVFGTTALYASATPSLTLRNNILNNLSTPSGTGVTTALRSNTINLSLYDLASNNNCFYAGTPSASNVIYSDGVNIAQTLPVYQGAVTPREVNSITENTPFLSLVGSNANFLHIDPTLPSLTESGAVNLTGITDDFDGDVRQGNTGYAGTGTAPDIGADEFNQTLPICSGVNAATISALSFSACAGETLSAYSTGYATGTGIIHQWQYSTTQGGPYINVPTGPTSNHHAYSTSTFTAGVYYLVMVSTCTVGPVSATSNELSFTVAVSPSSSISSQALVCEESNINLAGMTNFGTAYFWMGPNSFTSSAQNPTITNVSTSATGQYTFVTTANGCSSPVSVFSITVSGTTLNIANSDPQLCIGSTATLVANTSASTYTWLNNNAQTNSITVSPTVATIYTLVTTNANNCNLTRTSTISVISLTIAGVSATACANVTGTLTANTPTSAIVNWYASPTSTVSLGTGNNFTLSATTNTTIYAEGNSQKVDSLFTNVSGTSAFLGEMFDVVAINGLIITGFEAQMNAGTGTYEIWYRPGTHVGFETSNTGWTLASTTSLTTNGPGVLTPITSTLSIPIPSGQTYAFYIVANTGPNVRYSPGTTLGSVYASNSDIQILEGSTGNAYFAVNTSPRAFNGKVKYYIPGCSSGRVPATLSVSPTPTISIAQSAASVCFSTQATFTASGASTYSWVNGPNTDSFSINPTTASIFTVDATDAMGCTSSATAAIGVDPLPILSISPTTATVCESSLVSYTASGATTYTWSDNTVGNILVTSPTQSQTYTVTGTDNLGCVSTETVAVFTNTLPVVLISPASASVCEMAQVSFTASGATTYTWNATLAGDIYSLTATTSSVFIVEGTNNEGCTATATIALTTYSTPIVGISPATASVCQNAAANFTAVGASTYSWSTNATTATLSIVPNSNATYTVTGTSSDGCKAIASATVQVNPLPVVAASALAGTICVGESTDLTATGAINYSWSPVTGSTPSISVSPTITTIFTVIGLDANGCSDTTNVSIVVDACTGINDRLINPTKINVYPNPSSGVINVEFNVEGEKTITVTNSLGAVVAQINAASNTSSFDLSAEAKGIYFVNVNINGTNNRFKILVQ